LVRRQELTSLYRDRSGISEGADWGLIGGLLVITALGLLDLITMINLLGALLVGTMVAAALSTPLRTAGVALYAAAWALLLGAPDHWSTAHFLRITINVMGGAIGYSIARLRVTREEAMRRMIRIAEIAQQTVLRPLPDVLGEAELAVRYASAAEEALIGGDLYDAVETPYGLRVVVGDVRGKGLDGVRLASVVLGTFRDAAFTRPLLVDVVAAVDESVCRYVGDEDFISAVLVELSEHELKVVNLGHPSPLRYRRGEVDLLEPDLRSTPFGLSPTPRIQTFAVSADERILLYTDGVTECRDLEGVFFDLERGAREALAAPDLGAALDALIDDLTRHCGGSLSDDVALVLVAPRPPP
jgi:phosphoserine phosphatase RsbU/P